ncbi:hypothetical protein V9T40_008532 [Parthenolecanium corni]|uniref:Peptidase A2 domain-containing protein n=1 Tax=Parthenolecanium corni TaxID=536013 RepID=A0AAN9TN93_9HEMI
MDVGPSRTIATVGAQSAVHPNMPVNQQQLSELSQGQRSRGRSASPHPNRSRNRSRSRGKFDNCLRQAGEKQVDASQSAAEDAASHSRRLFIFDPKTRQSYLIDTGADVSVLPVARGQRPQPSDYKFYAANGTPINTYGGQQVTMDRGLRRAFKWSFIVADVSYPIIGADMLEHFALLVDLRNKCLTDRVTLLSTNCVLEARHFIVYTDHKPLVYAFTKKAENTPPHRLRHLNFISQYTTNIRHVKGIENIPADTLSRFGAVSVPTIVPYGELFVELESDEEMLSLLRSAFTGLKLHKGECASKVSTPKYVEQPLSMPVSSKGIRFLIDELGVTL